MWNYFIYNPLYNTFVFILGHLPNYSVAGAVIIFTILIKIILFPIYKKSILSQRGLKKVEPQLKELQKKFKDDKTELGKQTMALYKENGINPFSSIGLLLIQLPILIGLYLVFANGLQNHPEHLYSFVRFPENINTLMFGFIDAGKPFILLGVLAGITQAIQARISFPKPLETQKKTDEAVSFGDEFAKSMRIQVIYVLPAFIVLLSIKLPSAITLYWVVANVFGIIQEKYVKSYKAEQ